MPFYSRLHSANEIIPLRYIIGAPKWLIEDESWHTAISDTRTDDLCKYENLLHGKAANEIHKIHVLYFEDLNQIAHNFDKSVVPAIRSSLRH